MGITEVRILALSLDDSADPFVIGTVIRTLSILHPISRTILILPASDSFALVKTSVCIINPRFSSRHIYCHLQDS